SRDRYLVVHHADRHPLAAEAAHYAQPLIVATNDHRSNHVTTTVHDGYGDGFGQRGTHQFKGFRWVGLITRSNSFAANSAPETKPRSGPKLHAAGLPRKCNPGTEHSSPRCSTG